MSETAEFLKFIDPENQGKTVTELRVFLPGDTPGGKHRTLNGLYDDPSKLAAAAALLQSKHGAFACYFIGGVRRAVARRVNVFASPKRYGCRCVDEDDVDRRLVLPIDIDSIHPTGVMATSDERVSVAPAAERITAALKLHNFPDPIWVDTGNGMQLLYRASGSRGMERYWSHILGWLEKEHGTAGTKVDPAVYNLARILRLPGTINGKGANTSDRPHRVAHVVKYPEQWIAVSDEQVKKLALEMGYQAPAAKITYKATASNDGDDTILDLLENYPDELTLLGIEDRDGVTYRYIECPFDGYVHKGDYRHTALMSGAKFGFNCYADQCDGYGITDLYRLLHERTGLHPFALDIEAWGEGAVDFVPAPVFPPDYAPRLAILCTFGAALEAAKTQHADQSDAITAWSQDVLVRADYDAMTKWLGDEWSGDTAACEQLLRANPEPEFLDPEELMKFLGAEPENELSTS